MRRRLGLAAGWIAVTLALAYAAVALLMYAYQDTFLYHPSRRGLTPSEAGLTGVEALGLTTPDKLRIEAWYAPAAPGKPTILYFHGNGGELADRPKRFAHYQRHGYGVFFLSYRGYGASEGRPSEAGFIQDAETAYAFLISSGVSPDMICLVGESLGTGVAVRIAARHKVAAVALEAPYASILQIGQKNYWWLPVRFLLRDQFRTIEHIDQINAPLLVQHGMDDMIVPFAHGEQIFSAAREPKQFIRWPATGHVDLFDEPTWDAEIAFFERALAPPAIE